MTTIVSNIDGLTYREQIAVEALKNISHESLWIEAINKVMTDFSVENFRLLICSLLSQNDDNPVLMRRILGTAYESVVNLKNQSQ